MKTIFNRCPNCGKKPEGGLFHDSARTIYECRQCETLYCYKCGGSRCPDCGCKQRSEAGTCYSK